MNGTTYLISLSNLRSELGNSLGTFRDGMLGKFSRKHKADGSLNLTRRQSRFLVVACQLASLGCNTFKDVIDEGIHDGHSPLADSGIRVDLLEHLVDVRAVRFHSLGALSPLHGFLGGLSGFLTRSLGHFQSCLTTKKQTSVNGVAIHCEGP